MVGRSEKRRFASPEITSVVPPITFLELLLIPKNPPTPILLSYTYWVSTELTVRNTGTSRYRLRTILSSICSLVDRAIAAL